MNLFSATAGKELQVDFQSLLRVSEVLNGVCQILCWEVDPKSRASGARHRVSNPVNRSRHNRTH